MIKQCKGKDIHKIPKSKLSDGPYYYSTKFDGHYTQIRYDGENQVDFWTSGGKRFHLKNVADEIVDKLKGISFHIECEYLYDCVGKLGDRGKSAKLTTYRTEFTKGNLTTGTVGKDRFMVLDFVNMTETPFKDRLKVLESLFDDLDFFTVPKQTYVPTLKVGEDMAHQDYLEGFEGGMLKHVDHIYQPGKRVNDIVKLKPRLTADLFCVDVIEGEGKYESMIGALVLHDRQGRIVQVGSGLNDSQRDWNNRYSFMGKVIEIEYERIQDTYIQPIFKRIRHDKSTDEID